MKQIYLLITILALVFLFSCNHAGNNNESVNQVDTMSYTGVVLDAAMNSVFIITAKNDTLSFGYPNLERSKIQNFMLNDTITVNTQADTVISIINKSTH